MRLENVRCVDDVAEFFDQEDLFEQNLNIRTGKACQFGRPIRISKMPKLLLHDLQPTLMLSSEQFFVGQRIDFRTVDHLTMNQAHGLQSN